MTSNSSTNRLAIEGGPPVLPEGPPPWPIPDPDVWNALQTAYTTGAWGHYAGPHVEQVATLLAEMHGVEHVYCCASGTVAVELALRGLQVSLGDEVILAGYDFGGNFRCVEAVGARPVLVDINPRSWCLASDRLEAAASAQTKAIIVSHLHGGLADMPAICDWARQREVAVVEDACQAHGATVAGRTAGAWGDVAVLSFGGSKLLTAGRGGAVLTRRPEVFQRIKIHCEQGNLAYPLSELQACVLPPQVRKLRERNGRRQRQVDLLLRLCADIDALEPVRVDAELGQPGFYKVAWLYHMERCGNVSRDQFLAAVQAEGVAMGDGFRGFVKRSQRRCRKADSLAASRRAAERTVLLYHPVLLESDDVLQRVADALRKVVRALREK
jgi:dTDP-4-amino-4,6-dideoxygalactose transaminase